MTNITTYMIVNIQINDPDEYKIYEKGFFPYLKKHNGSFITFDDTPQCLEGETPKQFDRVVLFTFHLSKMLIIGGLIKDIRNYQNIDEQQQR